MSNVITELGTQPPAGTIILLQVGTLDITDAQGQPTALWNVTGWFSSNPQEQRSPQALQTALTHFPQGFEVAYSTSSDDLASASHTTLAMSLYFGCPDTLRVLLPGDPLETRLPDLNVVLSSPKGQPGTYLTQPAIVESQPLNWFLGQIMTLAGVPAPTAPTPGEYPQAGPQMPQAPAPVAMVIPQPIPEPIGIQLSPGVIAPVDLIVPAVAAKTENGVATKKKKTTTRRKKATPTA